MFILEIVALNDNDHVLGEVSLSCPDPAQIDAAIAHSHRFVTHDNLLSWSVARESATKMRLEVEDPLPWSLFAGDDAKGENGIATLSAMFPFCTVEHLQVDSDSVVARLSFEMATFEELELAMQNRP